MALSRSITWCKGHGVWQYFHFSAEGELQTIWSRVLHLMMKVMINNNEYRLFARKILWGVKTTHCPGAFGIMRLTICIIFQTSMQFLS